MGPLAVEQYLSLVHELTLWSPFPMEGYLAQPRYKGENLCTASSDEIDIGDSP